ncbi:hypothetical protein BC834DRAFT_939411 [Gloeopeniophorella convolvens]|nr:hypothetical protein BC834DRAFT_939411 [Gloeopeniophorella convolvens]
MNKTQFYLSECADAASKSPMCFTLGAVLVKGGKIISSGYNHHRPHYDGAEVRTRGHRKPVSMHAEMHAIFNLTGMSPSFRKQQGARTGTVPQLQTRFSPRAGSPPPPTRSPTFKGAAPLATCEGHPRRLQRDFGSADSGSRSDGRGRTRRDSGSGSDTSGASGRVDVLDRRRAQRSDGVLAALDPPTSEVEKAWSARRRDSRVNGADIYVARVTKLGMGSAKPCWRCVEWCRWAGVKRIFHWNGDDGKFDMVKVNTAERDQYETHADIRLYAGMGW